jgi:hypothetical protein
VPIQHVSCRGPARYARHAGIGSSWPFPTRCSRFGPAANCPACFEREWPDMLTRSLRLRMAAEQYDPAGKAAAT